MALYVIQARGTDERSIEHAKAVRDGFSWGAFVFAQLWLLAHRLWLALLVWIVLEAAFFLLVFPHLSGFAASVVDFLAHLYLGFEGNRLRLAKGARRAAVTAVVAGRSREEAEARFFAGALPERAP